jgi:hypothetical protein
VCYKVVLAPTSPAKVAKVSRIFADLEAERQVMLAHPKLLTEKVDFHDEALPYQPEAGLDKAFQQAVAGVKPLSIAAGSCIAGRQGAGDGVLVITSFTGCNSTTVRAPHTPSLNFV